MGMFNILHTTLVCPRCRGRAEMEIEFRFGLLELRDYRLGDFLIWSDDGGGLRHPRRPPAEPVFSGEGYAECPLCRRDFFVDIEVRDGKIDAVGLSDKPGYME